MRLLAGDRTGASTGFFLGEYAETVPSRVFRDASVSLGTAGKALVVQTAVGVALGGVSFKAVANEYLPEGGDRDGKVSLSE